jgi:hypothetical protein
LAAQPGREEESDMTIPLTDPLFSPWFSMFHVCGCGVARAAIPTQRIFAPRTLSG